MNIAARGLRVGILTASALVFFSTAGYSQRLYWTERTPERNISRANLDGSAREVLAIPDGKAFVGFLHRHETELNEMHETGHDISYVACTPEGDRLLFSGVRPASEVFIDLTYGERCGT